MRTFIEQVDGAYCYLRSMSDHQLSIVFMGTPDFAVPSLDILYKSGFQIKGVITAPDKPAGRGLKVQQSPVKQYATGKGIPVLQPTNLKDPEFQEELRSLEADLFVVVAFRILPAAIFEMPPKGTFNLHASLLPDYRGAAPINWAIINGEKETGVTTFFLEQKVDTGNIIFQERVAIGENETAGMLHDKLMEVGARLVLDTTLAIEENRVITTVQRDQESDKPAPKIFTQDCELQFDRSLDETYNLIRGLSPYPGAWTTWEDKRLKIFQTEKEITDHAFSVGRVLSDYETYIKLVLPEGFLVVTECQLEGKRRMSTEELLRGL